MNTHRRIISIAGCCLPLVSISAMRTTIADSPVPPSVQNPPEACTLLSNADASKALEVSSVTSKRLVAASPTGCVWSNDPAASDTSRRVALVTHSPVAFKAAMHPAITTIKIEPVSGIGDEAFYQIYPDGPFIWARKGNTAISIRIITQLKPKPFTTEQEKSKEAVLAKAAVAKL